ncbi:sporulation stage III protein AG [Senegalia massiliensis]|uniref:Sporulation stage III protein AG n=1 Tax=Senegalia massiliensis TaxID=1720316 RepID=A0A845QXX4_9CLOT|nr:sporulation stage III protein AG [Senegalia massiliensis]NBI06649.1 sporulation stage III protein AG [Senegalia massiliensis]
MKLEKHINMLFKKISSNKRYTNLAIVISIGIMLLIGISIFFESEESIKDINNIKPGEKNKEIYEEDYSNEIEIKLKKILSEMKGVGDVEVMVTLLETVENIPATNSTKNKEVTKENDSEGGTRDVMREESTEQIVMNGDGGEMITIKEVKPEIKGVIIAAEGANDIRIKETIYNAVKTVLGISGNKVEVYVKK